MLFPQATESFVKHCCKQLGITGVTINLRLVYNAAPPLKSAGSYDPTTDSIIVICQNRATADIYRTIAHELTHLKQKLSGVVFPDNDEELQKYEDEANIMSGRLVRFYGRNNPEIYLDLAK